MPGSLSLLPDGKGRVMSGLPELPAGREPQQGNQCCRYCRHWNAPPATLLAAYDAFREGITKRPVKQPAGHCDRVLVAAGRPVSFSTTAPSFVCLNFQLLASASGSTGDGMITIYEGNRIVWQGQKADLPDEYR